MKPTESGKCIVSYMLLACAGLFTAGLPERLQYRFEVEVISGDQLGLGSVHRVTARLGEMALGPYNRTKKMERTPVAQDLR